MSQKDNIPNFINPDPKYEDAFKSTNELIFSKNNRRNIILEQMKDWKQMREERNYR